MLTIAPSSILPDPTLVDASSYLSELRMLAVRTWPHNRTLTVACHGHSVPAGYFRSSEVQSFNAYPHLLHAGLQRRYPTAVFNVIVTAIGGEDSIGGAGRFARDVLTLRPDVVTIDYGLTDRRIGLELARAAWEQMIESALKYGARVLLLTPTPDIGVHLHNESDPLCQQARQIEALAEKYQVGLVDSLAAFRQSVSDGIPLSGLMSQANHPNLQGHKLVASRLLEWFC